MMAATMTGSPVSTACWLWLDARRFCIERLQVGKNIFAYRDTGC